MVSTRGLSACAALAAIALGGCGGGAGKHPHPPSGGAPVGPALARTVDIYSSLPLTGSEGAQAIAIRDGIRLALAESHYRAGDFMIHYRSLDDASPLTGTWDPTKTATNAARVAQDPRAVYYIGEFDSPASAISIQILNQAGIPQVSPASTYVGLTTNEPGSTPEEPNKYFPTGQRTFLRIIPRDSVQADAGLAAMRQDGCTRIAIANDRKAYGIGLATTLAQDRGSFGVTIVSNVGVGPRASSLRRYARLLRTLDVDCVYYAGIASAGAVQLARDVVAQLPHVRIYGSDQLCTPAFTNAADGGVPPNVGMLVQCTMPVAPVTAYPGGHRFLLAFRAAYHVANPDPYSLFGFEAMRLALTTIAGLGPRGDDKSAVLAALFLTTARSSVLGTYGFDPRGDTTLRTIGLYRVGPDGNPVFERTATG